MKKEEYIDLANKKGWDHLLLNYSNDIEEDFWSEFIGEIDIEMLLQNVRVSDDFMEDHKFLIGDKMYKKYKAIYFLCDLSDEGENVYSDVTKAYLSHLKKQSNLNKIVNEYRENSNVYNDSIIDIVSVHIREHYNTLGNTALSISLINKISRLYLDIQDFYLQQGVYNKESVKSYFKDLKKKGRFYSVSGFSSTYDDMDKTVLVVSIEPVEGIGNLQLTFLSDNVYSKFSFYY